MGTNLIAEVEEVEVVVLHNKEAVKDIMHQTKIKTIMLNLSLTSKRNLTIIKMSNRKRGLTKNSKTMRIKKVMMTMVAIIGTNLLSIIAHKIIRTTKKSNLLKPLHLWVKASIAFMRSATASLKQG